MSTFTLDTDLQAKNVCVNIAAQKFAAILLAMLGLAGSHHELSDRHNVRWNSVYLEVM